MIRKRTLLSWSSGKDSAWALQTLLQQREFQVVGLLTTFNGEFDRVSMHGIRRALVQAQAQSVGLRLFEVALPWPCSNASYEKILKDQLKAIVSEQKITHIAFGDLFLEDIRRYRENLIGSLEPVVQPLFPVWGLPTAQLAESMVNSGLTAMTSCVDSKMLSANYVGRQFDQSLLADLPETVDHCGENGEFHTFVTNASMFTEPVSIRKGEVITRDDFIYCDFQICEDTL